MEKKKSSMHLQFSQNCLLNYKLLVRDERIYFIDPLIRRNTVINKSGINGKRIEERSKGIFKKRLSSTVKLVGRERWIDQIKERHCRRRVKKKISSSHLTSWSFGYEHILSVFELDPTAYNFPWGWNSAHRTAWTSSSAVTGTNLGLPPLLLPLLASSSGLGSCCERDRNRNQFV